MRFKKKADCYFDTQTGLEWSLENYGPMTWERAISFPTYLIYRIPSMQELFTLIDYSKFDPATELPGMKSFYYWSSSTSAHYPDGAWLVNFFNGSVDASTKTINYYVRCVRGGRLKYAV